MPERGQPSKAPLEITSLAKQRQILLKVKDILNPQKQHRGLFTPNFMRDLHAHVSGRVNRKEEAKGIGSYVLNDYQRRE